MKVVRQAADVAGDVAAAFEQFVKRAAIADGERGVRRPALDVHAQEHQLLAQDCQLMGETGPLRSRRQSAGRQILGFW